MLKIATFYSLMLLTVGSSCTKSSTAETPPDNNSADTCPALENYVENLSDSALLDKVQQQTVKYFWDFAEPTSGMARERNSSGNTVTTGGSGFGIMAIIAGVHRGFIDRDAAVDRMLKLFNFLKNADRYHGAWSHWMDGTTGKTIPFGTKDDGGDLIETAFMVEGIIAAREFFDAPTV